jgi:hypothetical protein
MNARIPPLACGTRSLMLYKMGIMIQFCLMSVLAFFFVFFTTVVRWTNQETQA